MRSDIVFDALQTKNRFVLCHEAFKAIRLFHKNNTRIEDTTNDALIRLAAPESSEASVASADPAAPSLKPAV
jgi:hypothetical protein